MKKIITLMSLIAFTAYGQAQGSDRFYDSEGEYKKQVEANTPGNGDGVLDGDDPVAPIDDYIPLLLVAGLGMAAWYARQRQTQINRS